MFANCTIAIAVAITSAMENEITVSGIVTLRPGRKIFQKESRRIFHNLSLISIYPPYFYIFLDRITLQVRFKSSVFSYTPPPHARIPGKHIFQRPRGHLFMVGFKRKDLVFFYGIMLFTA